MALTNTQVIDNLIALLEKVKNNDSIDDVPDIKKLLTKLNNKAIKGKTIVVIKSQEDKENKPVNTEKKLTAYQLFVKEKMAELKDSDIPSNERFSKVAEMWNELNPKKDKQLKEPKEPKKPKELKEPKKPKQPKKNNKKSKEPQEIEEQDSE